MVRWFQILPFTAKKCFFGNRYLSKARLSVPFSSHGTVMDILCVDMGLAGEEIQQICEK